MELKTVSTTMPPLAQLNVDSVLVPNGEPPKNGGPPQIRMLGFLGGRLKTAGAREQLVLLRLFAGAARGMFEWHPGTGREIKGVAVRVVSAAGRNLTSLLGQLCLAALARRRIRRGAERSSRFNGGEALATAVPKECEG